MKFEKLNPLQFSEWDEYVDNHKSGTIFHKTTWLSLISPIVEVFVSKDNDKILGGVALIKTKKNGVEGYHIPAFTQYFSPLFGNPLIKYSIAEEHEFITELLRIIPKSGHIDFKFPSGHQNILPYHWKGFQSSVLITHTITDSDFEIYLKNLNKNKLRELKKLELMVENKTLSVETDIEINEFFNLMKKTGDRKEFNINENILKNIISKQTIGLYKTYALSTPESGYIGVGIFPYDNRTVYNLINASTRIEHPLLKTINLYCLYKAIQFALSTNRGFDFEGSMIPGIETFYRLMGGNPKPIYRVQKSPSIKYSLLRAGKQILSDRKKA